MLRDPFYQQIIDGLNRRVDAELFERCAAALLRQNHPTLVPIRGGNDAGMDGAIADGEGTAFPLICTTSSKVLANLRRSLNSYIDKGGGRRKAIVATSQSLTPPKRRNLENAASELGFTLVQVCDQAAIADLLYTSPDWCRELLALTGKPAALSMLPLTNRPSTSCGLIGREDDLDWLKAGDGDVILIGQPGAGKTYLLKAFAREHAGLFVISNDRTEIAADFRSKKPHVLIVDDAHSSLDLLIGLRQLRQELGATFRIIAASWPGARSRIESALAVSKSSVRELELLTRDQLVEVIKGAGIHGTRALVQELVEQSAGRPGLAVTLCQLCLAGGTREVALGDALSRDLRSFFELHVGSEAMLVLAILSLGGESGMPLDAVAPLIGDQLLQLQNIVNQLASGGVLTDVGRHRLVVRPEALRHALVRDTFFGKATCLPLLNLLRIAPDFDQCTMTLIGAKGRGGAVPDELLKPRVESSYSPDVWRMFASLGHREAAWVIKSHPEQLAAIGRVALIHAPDVAIPEILSQISREQREISRMAQSPLRPIEEWVKAGVPGTGDGVERREALFKSVKAWMASAGEPVVALEALSLALSPVFRNTETLPGSGRTFVFQDGYLTRSELGQIQAFWPTVVELMRSLPTVAWRPVCEMIESWAYPGRSRASLTRDFVDDLRSFAIQMLRELEGLAGSRLGILRWVKKTGINIEANLTIDIDPEFEAIYPVENPRQWEKSQREQSEAASKLADNWIEKDPATIAARLQQFDQEAAAAGITWPRWSPFVTGRIADIVANPIAWFSAMFDARVRADLVGPFLARVIRDKNPRVAELIDACLRDVDYRSLGVYFVLRMPSPPSDALKQALDSVANMPDLVRAGCFSGEIPVENVLRLLQHPSPDIAEAAALGEWQAAPGQSVRDSLRSAWRDAIVRASDISFDAELILVADALLPFEWLKARIKNDSMGMWRHGNALDAAIKLMNKVQRVELLNLLPGRGWSHDLTKRLVDGDVDVYKALLADASLKRLHLHPLDARPDETWINLAAAAMDAGYSAEEIKTATIGYLQWCGKESDMWKQWVTDFERLLSLSDPRIAEIGRLGYSEAVERRDTALRKERMEDVYGER